MRIGFLADEYATPVGEELIAAMRRQHPRLEVEFQQVDFADHHRALEDGRVDVAFVMGPVPRALTSVRLAHTDRMLAVSRAASQGTDGTEPGADPTRSRSRDRRWCCPTR